MVLRVFFTRLVSLAFTAGMLRLTCCRVFNVIYSGLAVGSLMGLTRLMPAAFAFGVFLEAFGRAFCVLLFRTFLGSSGDRRRDLLFL